MDDNQLKKILDSFKSEIKEQLGTIMKEQRSMQDSINRIDRDLGEDRKEIVDTKLGMGNLNRQLDEVRSLFSQQTQKIKETVHNAVSDNIESVENQMKEVKEMIGGDN